MESLIQLARVIHISTSLLKSSPDRRMTSLKQSHVSDSNFNRNDFIIWVINLQKAAKKSAWRMKMWKFSLAFCSPIREMISHYTLDERMNRFPTKILVAEEVSQLGHIIVCFFTTRDFVPATFNLYVCRRQIEVFTLNFDSRFYLNSIISSC